MTSRRAFLFRMSGLVAGMSGIRIVPAFSYHDGNVVKPMATAAQLFPEPPSQTTLQMLAMRGIDAARAAGATYADVRIGQRQILQLRLSGVQTIPEVDIGASLSYSVRAMLGGTWGFMYGVTATPDAVVAAAQTAVARAKAYTHVLSDHRLLVNANVEQGVWESPVSVPPFDVPLGDHADRMGGLLGACTRVAGVSDILSSANMTWSVGTTVFASTDGALVTQKITSIEPDMYVAAGVSRYGWMLPATAGYEYVLRPELEAEIKQFAEESVRYARLPVRRQFDIGRYSAVLDGASMSRLVGSTLMPALELDRALNLEANGVGTSVLSPPDQMLDVTMVSPHVTLQATRALPSPTVVQWDDEGVRPQPVTLIDSGRVVDYVTDRSTASALAPWYEKTGKPLRSNGYAIATAPNRPVVTAAPYARMMPGRGAGTMDDMIKELHTGVLLLDATFYADQHLSSGQLALGTGCVFAVERGQVTHQLRYAGTQFRTLTLWKSLKEIGGPASVTARTTAGHKGQPPQALHMCASAPAGLFESLDIFDNKPR